MVTQSVKVPVPWLPLDQFVLVPFDKMKTVGSRSLCLFHCIKMSTLSLQHQHYLEPPSNAPHFIYWTEPRQRRRVDVRHEELKTAHIPPAWGLRPHPQPPVPQSSQILRRFLPSGSWVGIRPLLDDLTVWPLLWPFTSPNESDSGWFKHLLVCTSKIGRAARQMSQPLHVLLRLETVAKAWTQEPKSRSTYPWAKAMTQSHSTASYGTSISWLVLDKWYEYVQVTYYIMSIDAEVCQLEVLFDPTIPSPSAPRAHRLKVCKRH